MAGHHRRFDFVADEAAAQHRRHSTSEIVATADSGARSALAAVSRRCLNASVAASVCLLVGSLACSPDRARAWGNDGHRIIGEIADRQLDSGPKAELRKLLPKRGRYRSLYEAATWADTFAREREAYQYLAPQHFINADPETDHVDVSTHCGESGCVVSAVIRNACSLKSGSGNLEERREALFLLAHFVGDVHQPLHVAHPDGRGGTLTQPRFFGHSMTLHALWDSGLIRHHLESAARWKQAGARGNARRRADDAAWELYAAELAASLPAAAASWKRELDPVVWADESLKAARRTSFDVKSGDRLAEPYYDAVMPVVARRLQRAGVRLAGVLNAVFSRDASLPYGCTSDESSGTSGSERALAMLRHHGRATM